MSLTKKLLTAAAQSGVIMFAGDVTCQAFVNSTTSFWKEVDAGRAAKMGLVGFSLHGPYMYLAFSRVDNYFGVASTLRNVLTKTAVIQLSAFPFYLCVLFAYLGFLEGRSFPTEIVSNVKEKAKKAYMAGCVFWPIANIFGFRYIPSHARVMYLASVGVVWNTYISYMNQVIAR